ncbi:MAG TPA: alkaline phosphatase family protein [Gemmatimonadaceae bacterium]|nr:alkaline phosphatase family protein [Gemmatimonadaceae bacterium]
MTPQNRPNNQLEVGELRERLRALGYLNAGVDRFVLAPAARRRSVLGLAWGVSVRIGLIAALLLGPAAGIGVAIRLPGLIAGARDAVVIVVYLALIFGGAAAVTSFLAAAGVTVLTRGVRAQTARRIGLGAGWAVGLACLAYLALWWNASGSVWSAPVRTLVAIAAAVAVSLLIGHAVSLASLALLARERGAEDVAPPVLSLRATLMVAAAAFLGTSGVLALSLVRDAPAKVPLFPVVPTGLRVVVIGIDGFDPQLRQGIADRLPVLTRLTRRAETARQANDTDPARVWTTVGTGMPSAAHGVSGFELRRVAGLGGTVRGDGTSGPISAMTGVTDLLRLTRPTAISGVVRREKMFWEVAAEHGFDAAVVNWWATWPATNTRAIVISDRAALRLERGGAESAEIAPASLYEPLRKRWPDITRRARELEAALTANVAEPRIREVLSRSAVLDAEQVLIARDPLLGTPDVLAVYLPGLDIAQHELLQSEDATSSASALASRVEAIRRYYVFLDGLVDMLLRSGPGDVVGLVTHPGRVGNAAALVEFSGGPIDANVVIDRAPEGMPSLLDVAPTVLRLLGMPISRELPGRADHWPVTREFRERHPVQFVAGYGRYAVELPAQEGKPLDEETLERLRSLGYIR